MAEKDRISGEQGDDCAKGEVEVFDLNGDENKRSIKSGSGADEYVVYSRKKPASGRGRGGRRGRKRGRGSGRAMVSNRDDDDGTVSRRLTQDSDGNGIVGNGDEDMRSVRSGWGADEYVVNYPEKPVGGRGRGRRGRKRGRGSGRGVVSNCDDGGGLTQVSAVNEIVRNGDEDAQSVKSGPGAEEYVVDSREKPAGGRGRGRHRGRKRGRGSARTVMSNCDDGGRLSQVSARNEIVRDGDEDARSVESGLGADEYAVHSREKPADGRGRGGRRGRKRGRGSGRGVVSNCDDDVATVSRRLTRAGAASEIARNGEEDGDVMGVEKERDGVGEECVSSEDDANFTVSRIIMESAKRRGDRKKSRGSPVAKVGEREVSGAVDGNESVESLLGVVKGSRKKRSRFSVDGSDLLDGLDEEAAGALDDKATEVLVRGYRLRMTRIRRSNAGLVECEAPADIAVDGAGGVSAKQRLRTRGRKRRRESNSVHEDVCGETLSPVRKRQVVMGGDDPHDSKSVVTPDSARKKKSGKSNRERSTQKEKVRDQIKGMLLSSGWKIDLRPRRGRDYLDSVYIPPKGKGSYWSITKAYSVFQEQLQKKNEMDKPVAETGESLKVETGPCQGDQNRPDSTCVIPAHLLSMLKRNVVNKRRHRIEPGEGRARGSTVVKSAKKTNGLAAPRSRKLLTSKGQSTQGKKKKNKRERGLLVREPVQGTDSDSDDYVPYTGKCTVLAWIIDSGIVSADEKVKYMNQRRTGALAEGLLKRDGIHCNCCNKLFTVLDFEMHAGSRIHQPYHNIFVADSELSLALCQLHAWQNQEESVKCGFYTVDSNDDPHDDTCGICGDGGELVCCDGCPSTFHLSCLDIPMLPSDEWYCSNCSCKFCGLVDSSAADEKDSCSDMPFCFQCEKKFHRGCAPKDDIVSNDSSASISFCSSSCKMIFEQLQNLLGARNELEDGFSLSIIRRLDNYDVESIQNHPGKSVCNGKIAVALAVMDECFLPITDQRSGFNLIHNVVYNCGSNFDRINFSGFYTFILERGDEMIAAASIRIHGIQLAEMPFIGTRGMYRRQGMCRRLLTAIESVLSSLHIEKLVIPAISELELTWTVVFGFKALDDKFKKVVKSMNLLVFPGTGLLEKPLLKVGEVTLNRVSMPIESEHYEDIAPNSTNVTKVSNAPQSFSNQDQALMDVSLQSENAAENGVAPESFLPNDEINLKHADNMLSCNSAKASYVSEPGFCRSATSPNAAGMAISCSSNLDTNGVTVENEALVCMLNCGSLSKVDANHHYLHSNEMVTESSTSHSRDCKSDDFMPEHCNAIMVSEVRESKQQLHGNTAGNGHSLQSDCTFDSPAVENVSLNDNGCLVHSLKAACETVSSVKQDPPGAVICITSNAPN